MFQRHVASFMCAQYRFLEKLNPNHNICYLLMNLNLATHETGVAFVVAQKGWGVLLLLKHLV
jgi:hypothetical protein